MPSCTGPPRLPCNDKMGKEFIEFMEFMEFIEFVGFVGFVELCGFAPSL